METGNAIAESTGTAQVPSARHLQWVGAGLAAVLLIVLLMRADGHAVWQLLSGIGPAALFIPLPFGLAMWTSMLSWRSVLRGLGAVVPRVALFRVRIAAEAVNMSVPGGAVWCEGVKPVWLRKHTNLAIATGTASVVLHKAILIGANGAYLATAAVIASPTVNTIFRNTGLPLLPSLIVPTVSAFMLAIAVGMLATVRAGRITERVTRLVASLPFVRRWRRAASEGASETDRALQRFMGPGFASAATPAFLWSYTHWLIEACETYLIFRLLQAPVGFSEAFAIEALSALVRAIAVFAPAGIGVQDAAVLLMLQAAGVPNATAVGTAFIVAKRSKELFWIGTGYGMMFLRLDRRAQHVR